MTAQAIGAKFPRYIEKEIKLSSAPISQGQFGDDVQKVQEWLCFHQCMKADGIDKDFGPHTAGCVREFQRKQGLPETGVVNEATYAELVKPLLQALEPVQISTGNTLPDIVLKLAQRHLSLHPIELEEKGRGGNCGPWVRLYMDGQDGKYKYWCAGFVTFVVQQACKVLNREIPIPRTYDCYELGLHAREKGMLIRGQDIRSGKVSWNVLSPCALFLRRDPHPPTPEYEWGHTGFYVSGQGNQFSTIEGNANHNGSPDGYEVCQITRSFSTYDYDFVRLPK
jgi:hypothetical protein